MSLLSQLFRCCSWLRVRQLALVGTSSLVLVACTLTQPSAPPLEAGPPFTHSHHSGIFTVYGLESDRQVLEDVAEALQTQAPQIGRQLGYDYQHPVTVEIFPDQDSLDQYGMNPSMQGYYAYSGDYHIQMVSPRNPIPRLESSYSQRVLIAVHEFVHLVNNAINPDMPLWLNEGVATYIGPHDVYAYVCQHAFPFAQVPTFADMEQSYAAVPAADLFAYSLVDFIVIEYGHEALNRLIRSPGSFEEVLGATRSEFVQNWQSYLREQYASQ